MWFRIIHKSQYFQKVSPLECLFIYFFYGKIQVKLLHVKIRLSLSLGVPTIRFYFTGSTCNGRSNSVFIPMTLLFSSITSAICSSPAANLNYRSLSGDLQMVHNSGLSKYVYYHVHHWPISHWNHRHAQGSVCVQVISPSLMIPKWVLPRVANALYITLYSAFKHMHKTPNTHTFFVKASIAKHSCSYTVRFYFLFIFCSKVLWGWCCSFNKPVFKSLVSNISVVNVPAEKILE